MERRRMVFNMKVKIIADSACDLRTEHFARYNITRVPLTVHLGEKEFKDGVDIQPKTLYDAMRMGEHTKTSQATPQDFESIFTHYAEKNQPLIYFAFSSELSGTYQSATIAKQQVLEKYPEAEIHIIDTKCASIGYGLVILRIAKAAQEGASVEEILELGTYHANHMEHIFTVDNLEYLFRGGRVSRASAIVGSLLRIKPLLHVENGKLVPIEKIRGSNRVLQRMFEVMEERGVGLDDQVIGISHGDDLERAQALADMIREKYSVKDIVIEMVGSVIGAHSGPGTIALFFLNQPYR